MAAGTSAIREALKWINDQMEGNPAADRLKLIDEASSNFNLSPLDGDFLLRNVKAKGQS